MNEQFEYYLKQRGYSITTPFGTPSTVFRYSNRVDKVCEWEMITWTELSQKINIIIAKYDFGGIHEHIGNKSNRVIVQAFKRYSEFLAQKSLS